MNNNSLALSQNCVIDNNRVSPYFLVMVKAFIAIIMLSFLFNVFLSKKGSTANLQINNFSDDYLSQNNSSLIKTGDNEYKTTTVDAWFNLVSQNTTISSLSFVMTSINIEGVPYNSMDGQIYYAAAPGVYSQGNSKDVTFKNGLNIIPIDLKGVKSIRLDLCSHKDVSFRIDSVSVNAIKKWDILKGAFLLIWVVLLVFISFVIKNPYMYFLTFILLCFMCFIIAYGKYEWLICSCFVLPFILYLSSYIEKKFNFEFTFRATKIFVLIACFLFYLGWNLSTPYNAAPDECMRYDVCRYIMEHNALPGGGDPEIRNETWGISYAYLPYTPSLFSVAFMKVFSYFGGNPAYFINIARISSILCGVLAAYFLFSISKQLFKDANIQCLFVMCIVFWPQYAFLSSYLNNDIFGLLCFVILSDAVLKGLNNSWSMATCVQLGISVGLGLISYYNIYPHILLLCIISLFSALKDPLIFRKAGVIFLCITIISGWWFIRNAILYDGDVLALKTANEQSEKYAFHSLKPSNRQTFAKKDFGIINMLSETTWINSTCMSFFGTFGWMSVYLPALSYFAMKVICLIGLGGVALYVLKSLKLFKNRDGTRIFFKKFLFVSVLMSFIVLSVALSIYFSYHVGFQPQGRYIFCILPIVIYLLLQGFVLIDSIFCRSKMITSFILFYAITFSSIAGYYIIFIMYNNV